MFQSQPPQLRDKFKRYKNGDSTFSEQEDAFSPDSTAIVDAILLILAIALLLAQIFDWIYTHTIRPGTDQLDVSIRANSIADYSYSLNNFSIPPISESILQDIIRDTQGTSNPDDRIATLEAVLTTSVPSVTSSVNYIKPTVVAEANSTSTPIAPEATSVEPITPGITLTPAVPVPTNLISPTMSSFPPTSVPTLPVPTLPPIFPSIPMILPTNLSLP